MKVVESSKLSFLHPTWVQANEREESGVTPLVCPPGYHPNATGTMCIKDEEVPPIGTYGERVATAIPIHPSKDGNWPDPAIPLNPGQVRDYVADPTMDGPAKVVLIHMRYFKQSAGNFLMMHVIKLTKLNEKMWEDDALIEENQSDWYDAPHISGQKYLVTVSSSPSSAGPSEVLMMWSVQ